MSAKELRQRARFVLFFFLELLKKAQEVVGIVTRSPQVLSTELIGFSLDVAAELQKGERHADLRSLIRNIPEPASHENQRYHRIVCDGRFGCLLDAVSRGNVGNLVGHHACKLSLAVGRQYRSLVYVKKSAGQCESIHVIGVQHFDRKGNLRIGVKREVLPDSIHIFGHHRVFDELALSVDISCKLAPHIHFFVKRVEVDLVLVNVALADKFWVLILGQLTLCTVRACGRRLRLGGLLVVVRSRFVGSEQGRRRADRRRQRQDDGALEKNILHLWTPNVKTGRTQRVPPKSAGCSITLAYHGDTFERKLSYAAAQL